MAADNDDDATEAPAPSTDPVPESWTDLGGHEESGRDDVRLYAVEVRDEGDGLVVRYVTEGGAFATTRTFDAYRHEGGVVPQCVADDGPTAWPASITEPTDEVRYSSTPTYDGDQFTIANRHDTNAIFFALDADDDQPERGDA